MAYTLEQFGQLIKKKHPDYQSIDDTELAKKMIEKFPDYKAQVITSPGVSMVLNQVSKSQEAKGQPIESFPDPAPKTTEELNKEKIISAMSKGKDSGLLESFQNIGEKTTEGVKSGLGKLANAPVKFSEAITGYEGGLSGVPGAPGVTDPQELSAYERGVKGTTALLDVPVGAVNTAFAAPSAILPEIPVVGKPAEAVISGVLGGVGSGISGGVKFVADKLGVELTPEQIQAIDEGGDTLAGLFMMKMAKDASNQAKSEAISTQIQQAMREGDLNTVKTLLPQYEAAIVKPTVSGTIGQGISGLTGAAVEGGLGIAGAGLKGAGKVVGKAGEGISSTSKFMTSKATGLNPETLSFVNKNPKLFEAVQKGELTREAVAKEIVGKITQQEKMIGETGKVYDIIRQSGDKVTLPKEKINTLLTDKGLKIKDGKITETNPLDTNLSAADLSAIDKAYGLIENKKTLTANEYLNFRNKVDDFVNWKTDVSNKGQSVVKQIRKIVDDVAKEDIQGLKELDATYGTEISALKQLKKDYFNKDGTLQDNALSKMGNLTNKGREAILDRIEKLSPGLGDKIRALKAFEDVTVASGNKVGAYGGSGVLSVGTGMITGSLPAGIATMIATNPKVVINAIKNYAKIRNLASDSISNIIKNVESKMPLAPKEAAIVTEAVDYSKPPLLTNSPANTANTSSNIQSMSQSVPQTKGKVKPFKQGENPSTSGIDGYKSKYGDNFKNNKDFYLNESPQVILDNVPYEKIKNNIKKVQDIKKTKELSADQSAIYSKLLEVRKLRSASEKSIGVLKAKRDVENIVKQALSQANN